MTTAATLNLASSEPLGQMNTTPLIDVMLVLLVMFILAVPAEVNQVAIDLPSYDYPDRPPIHHDKNVVSVTPGSAATWNGQPVSRAELGSLLHDSLNISPEPELQFQPDPAAPYDGAAKVLGMIKASGVTAFGFVGNDRYADFGKAAVPAAGH